MDTMYTNAFLLLLALPHSPVQFITAHCATFSCRVKTIGSKQRSAESVLLTVFYRFS